MLYGFAKGLTYLLVRILFRMRYEGLENIPKGGGYILACNHRGYFDPLFIAHKLPVQVHYIGKSELVRNRLLGKMFRWLGVIPIRRGEGDTGALDVSVQRLCEGGVLGIFPEGKRSRDGNPQRGRSGISVIAGRTGADILPCAVIFGDRLRFRCDVTVRYGAMIPNEALGVNIGESSTVRAASKLVMGTIVGLLKGEEDARGAG